MNRKSEGFFGHDVVEIFSADLSSVGGGSLEHFFEFSNVHGLSQLLCDSLDVIDVDESSLIIVEQVEYFIDTVLKLYKDVLLILCRPVLK